MNVAFQPLAVPDACPAQRGRADDLEDDIAGGFEGRGGVDCGSRRMVARSAVTMTVRRLLSALCSTQLSAPPGSRTRAQPSWVTMISTGVPGRRRNNCRPWGEGASRVISDGPAER